MNQGATNGKSIDYRKVTLTQNQGILGVAADRRAGKRGLFVSCSWSIFGVDTPSRPAHFINMALAPFGGATSCYGEDVRPDGYFPI